MNKKTTADRLNEILLNRNLKQIDILNLCKPYCQQYNVNIKKNDLSQYISGKVVPKQDKLSILALALGVNEVWLMGYDVPSHSNGLNDISSNYENNKIMNLIVDLNLNKDQLNEVYEYAKYIKEHK